MKKDNYMKLVICLGNPGEKYVNTRHNAGFMFADALANKLGCNFSNETKFKAHIAKGENENEAVWIIKPQTYMNLSGEAFIALKNFYKIDIKTLFVAYDDIALDLGKIRFRSKGSDGGHNGIKSIINHTQTQKFDRLKIGIGPQPPFMKSEDFVLQNFTKEQQLLLNDTIQKCVDAFLFYCKFGTEKAQNKYN